jgi:rhodanese-related sulfurtransferase
MVQILPADLARWLADDSRPKPVMIDVREPWEFARCSIDESLPIPMATVPLRLQELDPQAETILICHHGARSFQVGMFLEQRGFGKLYNLQGGVDAWARTVDPAMATY